MKHDKTKVWRDVLSSVRVSVSPAIFSTWLSQTHLVSLRKLDKTRYMAEVGCTSGFVQATVEKRYFGLLQDALMTVLGEPCDVTFTVKQNTDGEVIKIDALEPLFATQNKNEELQEKLVKSHIRPGFTFENFAVSGSNQMAHAAAEAVAEKPGISYNPLFLWGGVGVGKTHLMHAVGHKILEQNSRAKIIACTGEDFTNDIVQGIRNKTTESFRNKYRTCDALLIDDIQFIAGKESVQEEFFHTFNAVTGFGGQIILTSDKPPSDISRLEERLRSRFEAGLIVDIAPPDFELRCAIVQIKAQEKAITLLMDHVHLIAGNVDTARKIEGFLIRLGSETKLRKQNVSEDLIKSIMGKGTTGDKSPKSANPEIMIDAVCTHYSVGRRAIMGKARSKMISHPRQVLMYLLRTELNLPLEEVGRLVGGRDHTTVMHGVDKITRMASTDVQIREDILRIKNTF